MALIASFFKDSLMYTVPGVLSRGIAVLLLPLYTRLLSPADYGVFDIVIALGVLVNVTVALEISQGLARYYADGRDANEKRHYVSAALWFTAGAYAIFGIICCTFAEPLAYIIFGQKGLTWVLKLGLLYFFANGLFTFLQGQFRWEMKSVHYAVASLIVAGLTAVLSLILGWMLGMGLAGLVWALILANVFGCGYGLWFLRHNIMLSIHGGALRNMLVFSAPLVPSGFFVFASYYADRFLVRHFLDLDAVGIYGVGFRLASLMGLVMIGVQTAMTPLIFKHYKDEKTPQDIAAMFRVIVGVSILMVGGITFFSGQLLWMFTTPEFYGADVVLLPLALSFMFANLYVFMPGVGIAKKTYLIPIFTGLGAACNIALNCLLIPLIGIVGAAIATMLGYALTFGLYAVYSQKYYPVPHRFHHLAGVVFALLAMIVAMNFIDVGGLLGWIIAALLSCVLLAGIVIFRLVTLTDIGNGLVWLTNKRV